MRSSVYLSFATATLVASMAPVFAMEMAIGDSAIIVYGDAYTGTAHDAAYGNPYGDSYVSGDEVIFMQEAEYTEIPVDPPLYSAEAVASLYAVETIESINHDPARPY